MICVFKLIAKIAQETMPLSIRATFFAGLIHIFKQSNRRLHKKSPPEPLRTVFLNYV